MAVKGIIELSLDHQVLFFTCHSHMVELFRKENPGVPVMEISGGVIKK